MTITPFQAAADELDRLYADGVIGDDEWHGRMRWIIEEAYLAGDNPRSQSGFGRDASGWERARGVIVRAIDRDGTYLDVGCANGHLMECIVEWARRRGYAIEPHGLDISPALAKLARSRLPQWADRISTGNAASWEPSRRFDFVQMLPELEPPPRRPALVERLIERVVAPGGRLIVCSYGSATRREPPEPVGEMLRAWGHRPAGEAEAVEPNGAVVTRVAWIDACSRTVA